MAIQFSCSLCGKHLRVRDGAAGRKCRCPSCGNVATIPGAEPPPLPSAARQGVGEAGADHDADGAAVVPQPNWTVRIVVGILGVGAIVIGFVGYYGYSSSHQKMEERDRLTRLIHEQVGIAADKAEQYDFGSAKDLLLAAATEVVESPYADTYLIDDLNRKLDAARYDLERREADHRDKIRAGWTVIDGRLVSPADQQRALAEKKRREEQEAKRKAEERRMAQARAKAEAEARAKEERRRRAAEEAEREGARQAAEEEAAKRMVAEAVRNLPSLQAVLDDRKYISDRVHWLMWYLSLKIVSLGGDKPEHDPSEYQMLREDLTRYVQSVSPSDSPLLVAYRDEILDIMQTLAYPAYVSSPDERKAGQVPIRFSNHTGKPVLLLGSVLSDTNFNNVNPSVNTPKKRAASFMQREVLPVLLSSLIPERLKSAQLGYFGITFVYGNSNLVRDKDTPTPESLCIVLSMRDYVAFVNRELSQESLVKNSLVFLASEGAKFIKVELNLE
jgi:hypothetical protein